MLFQGKMTSLLSGVSRATCDSLLVFYKDWVGNNERDISTAHCPHHSYDAR